ncbi:MAG TPA: response regulator [Tepidisphaeraceae bacterium]|nr:response regulator [Tepidisphaeraceae bacterium]
MPLPLRILVAEDNPDDEALLRFAFKSTRIVAQVHYVRDGQQAIDYLAGKPPFENPVEFPVPTLLLLDLRMPGVDGFGVLKWLGRHPELRGLVSVVVLSGTVCREDIDRACALGAQFCLSKPQNPEQFIHLARRIEQVWNDLQQWSVFSGEPCPQTRSSTSKTLKRPGHSATEKVG